jgi:hypothetical protein
LASIVSVFLQIKASCYPVWFLNTFLKFENSEFIKNKSENEDNA